MMININKVDFDKGGGIVPAIIQDHNTGKVLMMGYMNREALAETVTSKWVTFYSRSKGRLWRKGEESNNTLAVKSISADCDHDTLLIQAIPAGPTCHLGSDSCWGESNEDSALFLQILESVIIDRRDSPSDGSYTSSLFAKGINKVAQKVGEEAVEMVIEAKDDNDVLFRNEAADLLYHYLVLLAAKKVPLSTVISVLRERHQA